MTQHIQLDFLDPVHQGFFDPIQELLGAAVPSLSVTVLNATTLRCVASAENGQVSAAIQGRYRWVDATITAALPATTPNGTHPVYITASENDFSGPETEPDEDTDYSFALEIRRTADGDPSTDIWRKVGEVDVTTQAITAYRNLVGPRHRDQTPVWLEPTHATQSPLRVKGIATQTAPLILVEDSAGADVLTLDAAGNVVLAGDLTVGDDLAANDIHATGALDVDGNANVDGDLQVDGTAHVGGAGAGAVVVTQSDLDDAVAALTLPSYEDVQTGGPSSPGADTLIPGIIVSPAAGWYKATATISMRAVSVDRAHLNIMVEGVAAIVGPVGGTYTADDQQVNLIVDGLIHVTPGDDVTVEFNYDTGGSAVIDNGRLTLTGCQAP